MSARLFPRLDRQVARERLATLRSLPPRELTPRMPLSGLPTTFSPVGGVQVTDEQLAELRAAVVAAASLHGFPDRERAALGSFDTDCARTLHETMGITAHEAGHEEVWTHLTLVWLLDVAAWRYPRLNDERVIGTADRNTFRRLWWRALVLQEPDRPWHALHGLGEDELVQIMERPTLWGQPELARALARRFAREVAADPTLPRMDLMRDTARRLVRVTPFVMTDALTDEQLAALVDRTMRASTLALAGRPSEAPPEAAPEVTVDGVRGDVEVVDGLTEEQAPPAAAGEPRPDDPIDDEPVRVAVALAVRLGRVTNATLREATGLDSVTARRVLLDLVTRGVLEQRGAKRGTHYVLRPASAEVEILATSEAAPRAPSPAAAPDPRPPLLRALAKAVRRRGAAAEDLRPTQRSR